MAKPSLHPVKQAQVIVMTSTRGNMAAVIVCHNAAADLASCLAALNAGEVRPAFTCIVDTGSDETAYLKSLVERPNTLCLQEANIGYGAGNNKGLAAVPPEIPYVLFLNPDCFVAPDMLARALPLFLKDASLACLGPRLLGFDRKQQAATGLLDSAGVSRAWYGRWYDRGQGSPDDDRYSLPQEMPALCGACLLCRRTALEAVAQKNGAVFDPAFFLYKEDIELCLRLKAKGFRLLYHPALRAWHCRGWQRRRTRVPYALKLMAAENEIRLYRRHPSVYMLWALAKYLLVRCMRL